MLNHKAPNPAAVPGFWDIKNAPTISAGNVVVKSLAPDILTLESALTTESCDALIKLFESSGISAPVSVSGMQDDGYGVGSDRATGWSPELASALTSIIIPHLEKKVGNSKCATDWWQSVPNEPMHQVWEPVEISPLLRFMKYKKDSEHFAHYDAGFFYPDGEHRTLKSVVIYLTTNNSGATRFIEDGQGELPVWDRNHSDWNRRVESHEVKMASYPVKGKILIFDHRLCHDVEQFDGLDGDRIIIRGDVIYKKGIL